MYRLYTVLDVYKTSGLWRHFLSFDPALEIPWNTWYKALVAPLNTLWRQADQTSRCTYWFLMGECHAFFHYYQGSVNSNPVNIRRTEGMYFLVFTATGMIFNDMISRYHNIQYTPCSLGSELGNTTLGTVFLDTLPRANIRNTSSRGKHSLCSRNDADRHNVDTVNELVIESRWEF